MRATEQTEGTAGSFAVPAQLVNAPLPIDAPTHVFMHMVTKYNIHATELLKKRQ